ncbi:GntR family transcriptional regulator [Rhodovulum sp. 12E13]|uniref:GntR family transcriptional regulator n=1 Tax=Rhodovulum sp. 12E13 TaxID=2203891 RepID=UPI000E19E282|nr:GntR family transcriptional regulator [Rhodovulum sp. 12E13]RDC68472.1 GntR family transcriptional regulator [Rhodovulum sp. 12E13]
MAVTSETSASRKRRCSETLRRRILTMALEPGAHLDEGRLAEEFGLSRPPLREILRELAGEGYVALAPHRGAQVAPMTHRTLNSFFRAAPMIYAATARLAAEAATEAQIMRLKDTQLLFRAAIRAGDAAERALLNERFHAIIGEMAHNDYLAPSLRRLLIDHTRIGMTFYDPRQRRLAASRAEAADQHDRFIDLIEAGDTDGAEALARAHWELSRLEMERFIAPAPVEMPLDRARREGA